MSNCLEEYVMVIEGEKNFNTSEAPLIPTLIGCKYLTKKNWVVMIDLPAGNMAFNNYVMNIKDITFATLKTDLQFAFLTCQLVSQEVHNNYCLVILKRLRLSTTFTVNG